MNYSRFYALLNRLPVRNEEIKEQLVLQFTNQRTDSLRKMNVTEYNAMCNALDRSLQDNWKMRKDELKSHRSKALHLMQQLGIDTSDWVRVNAFCRDARIVGKEFAEIDIGELEELTKKLRTIKRNGGLKPQQKKDLPQPQTTIYIPINNSKTIN